MLCAWYDSLGAGDVLVYGLIVLFIIGILRGLTSR